MEKRKINFTDNDTRKTKISQSQKARYKRLNQQYVSSQLHEEYNADMSSIESLENLLAKISGRIANHFLMICDLITERASIKSKILSIGIDNAGNDDDNGIDLEDIVLNPNGIKKKITITPEQKDRLFNEQ